MFYVLGRVYHERRSLTRLPGPIVMNTYAIRNECATDRLLTHFAIEGQAERWATLARPDAVAQGVCLCFFRDAEPAVAKRERGKDEEI